MGRIVSLQVHGGGKALPRLTRGQILAHSHFLAQETRGDAKFKTVIAQAQTAPAGSGCSLSPHLCASSVVPLRTAKLTRILSLDTHEMAVPFQQEGKQ